MSLFTIVDSMSLRSNCKQTQVRNFTHLIMVFSLLFAALSPLFDPALAYQYSTAGAGVYASPSYAGALPGSAGEADLPLRAPYLPGHAPQTLEKVAKTFTPNADSVQLTKLRSQNAAQVGSPFSSLPNLRGPMSALPTPITTTPQLPNGQALGAATLPAWFTSSPALPTGAGMAVSAFSGLMQMAPGDAQCTPADSLVVQLSLPPTTVSRGNTLGDVYTVTVTNNGVISTTDVSLLVDPNVGFFYKSGSANVISNLSPAPSLSAPGADTAADAAFTLRVTGATTATRALQPGETMQFQFRLVTTADAKSGQALAVTVQSGDPTVSACKTRLENVQTGRGNLVVLKSPSVQEAGFGDTVTWTITLRNNGLGMVYDGLLADAPGSGLAGLTVSPALTPVNLQPEQSKAYTVTAQIAACTDLTNEARAHWTIGNQDGTATLASPVTDDTDIIFHLEDPNLQIEIEPMPDVAYCGSLNTSLTVTVTNIGGAARNLRLNLAAQNVTVGTPSGLWTRNGNTLTYTGGAPLPAGTLRGGERITFEVPITTGDLCAQATAAVEFTPVYADACQLLEITGDPVAMSNPLPEDAPTLVMTKTAVSELIIVGQPFTYTINVAGENEQSIAGGIAVTDIVTTALTINSVSASRGTMTQTGNTVQWRIPTTGSGPFAEMLSIQGVLPDTAACPVEAIIPNTAIARASVCPECELTATDTFIGYVVDFLDPELNQFSKTTSSVELCSVEQNQTITADLQVGSGITWTNTVYTDTLGADQLTEPLTVISGSVNVLIDGVDYTDDVTITRGPPLVVNFSHISDTLGAAFAPTAHITISYAVTNSGTISGDLARNDIFLFSEFNLNGPAMACDGSTIGSLGTLVTLERGNLDLSILPGVLNACRENMITLTVTGGSVNQVTEGIQVVFTPGPSDIITPTTPSLGGGLAGQPITVTRSNGMNPGSVVTFTFAPSFDLDTNGTITFPLFRPCGAEGALAGQIDYLDQCRTPRNATTVVTPTMRAANLTLFTTPNRVTVHERNANWRFYVSNGGDLGASTTYVTNTLPAYHHFSTYTVTSTFAALALLNAITAITGTAASGREVVTFTIPAAPGLAAGDRLQFDVASEFQQCTPAAFVDIALFSNCSSISNTCGGRATGRVEFIPGATSLLSSNDQTANLPLCEVGQAKLVIKNTSPRSQEFDLTITDRITNGTFIGASVPHVTVTNSLGQVVVGATSGMPLVNIPFAPTSVTSNGINSVFTWTVSGFVTGTAQYDVLKVRDASDQILIIYSVKTGCIGEETKVQASGQTKDVCALPLSFLEDSKSFTVDKPALVVTKRGRNLTTGTALAAETFASAGDTVVWQIDVQNIGQQRVTNLFITDTVPANYTITNVNHPSGYGTDTGSAAEWGDQNGAGGLMLAAGATQSFIITGTVGGGSVCALEDANIARVAYGCSTTDICLAAPIEARATMRTRPTLGAASSAGNLSSCGGLMTLEVNSDGPSATNVTVTDTLPAGLVYEALVSITPITASNALTMATTPVDGDAVPTFEFRSLPGNQSGAAPVKTTITYRVRNANSNINNACIVIPTSVSNRLDVAYDDTCTLSGPYTTTHMATLGVGQAALAMNQAPFQQTSDVGQTVTWTLRVTNTGNAVAPNISISDVVPSGFANIVATNGSGGQQSTTAILAGNVITWSPPFTLAANGVWTAQVTAQVNSSGQHTSTVQATGRCGAGCIYANDRATSYVSLLQTFVKGPQIQTGTIGALAVFTVTNVLPSTGGIYNDTRLTDTLPTGLGYVAARLVYTSPVNGVPTTVVRSAPDSFPAANATGNLIWNLGDLTGTVQLSAVITTVIQSLASNYDGVQRTNAIALGYVDNGLAYHYTDTAHVDVIEPLLHLGKHYVTSNACSANLFQDNFNDGDTADWSLSGGTWSVTNGTYRAATGVLRRAIAGNTSWTNYSYSAMVFSTDPDSGDLGLIFRAQDSTHYYRFRWTRNAAGTSGNYVLERVDGGTVTALGATAGSFYALHRWYHVEVRVEGNRFRVYIDGVLALDRTESTSVWTSGRIGFYADNQSNVFFDDALVTRLDDAGCFVGDNDLVTYTLTISNQGRAIGQELVITDVVPTGMSYVTSNLTGTDPTASLTTSPSGGATDTLVWRISHLTPTVPFDAANHTALNLHVVLRVAPEIGAQAILSNQATLAYDSQTGAGPAGIQQAYSGGSHSTAVQTVAPTLLKATAPITLTIGEAFRYTITLPSQPITATLHHVTVTDQIPANVRVIGAPQIVGGVGGSAALSSGNNITVTFTSVPSATQASVVITGVVRNTLANQQNVQFTNRAQLGWTDHLNVAKPPILSNMVTNRLIEPTLIVQKSVQPASAAPGDTVFYEIRVFHAPTSTIPAYNVRIDDLIPTGLQYSFGSWPSSNLPIAVANTGTYTDATVPALSAYFPVISPTLTAGNPLIIRYQAVVDSGLAYGSVLTNVVTTTWTSLPNNLYGEDRSGTGGVNDYKKNDRATVALSDVLLDKTGPLTVTAGSVITYLLTVNNLGPFTATNGIVRDVMPFQVTTLAAHFDVPTQLSGPCTIAPASSGDVVTCAINDLPNHIVARIVITGLVDADTPLGADLTNAAEVAITSADGRPINNEDEVETEVYTASDLEVNKRGPTTAVAGQTITYTIVLTNNGPSVSRAVDVKDQLPPGITFVSGSTTQGICVSAICQTGDVQPGQRITMVITGTVDNDVTGIRTNRAQVFSATTDPNSANNVDTWATTVSRVTALQIRKVDLSDPVYAGNTYFYEIVVTNTGLSDAANVIITDTLPSQVAFQGSSPECSHNGATSGGAVQCALGRLTAGESRDFLINVQVNPNVVSGTLGVNTVGVTTTTPIDLARSTLTDSEATRYLQTTGLPTDLRIVKSVSPASAIAGSGRVTYTLVVTNSGPAPASAVQVVDAFPRQFSFVSAVINKNTTTALCSNDGVCDLGNMAVGESARMTLVFDVPSAVVAASYLNTAHVSSPAPDSNLANNTASIPVNVTRQATLQIRKVAYPNPAVPGQDLTYMIIVTNTGPSDANSVTVTDTLPSTFSQALILSSQGGCASLPCNLGTLPANRSASVTIVGRVAANATAALNNTAQVTSQNPSASAITTIQTPIAGTADLALVKRATATTTGGGVITYTLTVFNAGPADAQSVRITDSLPTGVTVINNGGCAPTGNLLVCHAGTVAVGSPVTFTLRVNVDADLTPGTSLENQAVVHATTPDPDLANNTAVADTSILGSADLRISKVQIAPLGAVNAGESVTYRVTITNSGPSLARSVDVKDQLPAGLTLQSIQASGGGVCGGAVCQFGTLPAGATRTITVVAGVDSASPAGVYTNTAAVYSTDETNQANNTATATTTVTVDAALRLAKVDLFDPVAPGGGQLYQLVISNDGPSAARNVMITDTLPANVTFSNASPGCLLSGTNPRVVVCSVGTLAAGAMQSLFVAVQINDNAINGALLTNNLIARTSTTTTVASASATTTVQGFGDNADLGIRKSTTASSVTAGERITYTLLVTNAGPSVATNAQLLDLIPAGTTVVTLTAENPDFTGEFCSLGGACYLGTVLTNTTATVQVVLQVNPNFAPTTLTNSANVAADQQDPEPSNNFSSTSTPVNRRADLSVAKTGLPDPIIVGETLLYQIVVTNSGPSDAQAVVITDTLDANTRFSGATPGCTHDGSISGGLIICTVGTLAAGDQTAFLLNVRVDPGLTVDTVLTNTVAVGSTTPDPVPANNTAIDTTQAQLGALVPIDLAIQKSATPTTVTAGETVTYTLVVTNHGDGMATNVQVVDALPLGAGTLRQVTSSQGLCSGGVTCDLGDLPTGATATITLVVQVHSDQISSIINQARVSASNPDRDPSNNEASVTTAVTTLADVNIVKSASPVTATPGRRISYQIVVSNAGPSDARAVVVSDALPVPLSAVQFSASQGSCTVGGSCTLGEIPAGGQATISVIGTVAANATAPFTNTATVVSTTPDNNPGNNSSSVSTAVSGSANLALDLTSTPTVSAGESAVVTVTLFNNGPSYAAGAVITVTLPANTNFTGDNLPAGWFVTDNGDNTLTLTTTQSITPGVLIRLPFTVAVDPDVVPGTSVEFSASVTATTFDPNLFDNFDNSDTSVVGEADLTITKAQTAPIGAVAAGERVTYTLTITNNGPSLARSVDVKDQLPAGLTLTALRASNGGICGGAVCQFGTLAVNATRTITVVARVAAETPAGSLINTAAVYSTDESGQTNNTASATTLITTRALLRIEKLDLFDPVAPGGGQLYQIIVHNDGPSDAQRVIFTDTLPAGVTWSNSSPACTHNGSNPGGLVVCDVGTLAAGSATSFFVAVQVNENATNGAILTNAVTATSSTTNTATTDTVTSTVQGFGTQADLGVVKSTLQSTVSAGERITYTLLVTNVGPSVATNVQLLELMPAGTTVVILTADNPDFTGEFCSLGGTCYLGSVLTDTIVTVQVMLQVNPDFVGATLVNNASVAGDQQDPDASNNFSSTSTPVNRSADLGVTKVDLPDPIIVGETLLYQIVVTNSGPSDAQAVIISDTLDVATMFAGATPGCTHDGASFGGIVTCTVGGLAAGATADFLLEVRVDPALITNTVLLNQVSVRSATPDPNPINNLDSETTQANLGALVPVDLAIAKTATPSTVTAGEWLTYTLVVTNNGDGTASNVQVIDALPLGSVTLISSTSSQGLCNAGVDCALGDMAVDATATITLVVRVDADQTTDLLNVARVSASNPDNNPANNQASAATLVVTSADVGIAKTVNPTVATPGASLSYQLVISNAGPATARGVSVSDLLPVELSAVRFATSQGSCNAAGLCVLGDLPVGGRVTISVIGTVAANAQTAFTNTAVVNSSTPDSNPANNTSSVTTNVQGSADLGLDMVATPTTIGGGTATVTVTVFNQGPSNAHGAIITLTLPLSTSLAGGLLPAGWGYIDNGNNTLTIFATGPITPGAAVNLPFSVNVAPNVEPGTSLEFTAVVTATTADPNPFNNRADADTSIIGFADLTLHKQGPSTLVAGERVTYTVIVTNNGPSTAQSVDIKDALPTGIALINASIVRSQSGMATCGGPICQTGDMNAGETVTMTVIGVVAANVADGTVLSNTAAVSSDTPDGNPLNNLATVTATVRTRADIRVTKVDLNDPVAPTQGLLYQIVVFNVGPSDAQAVVVTDTLDANVSFSSASASCALNGNSVVCTVGTLAAASSQTFLLAVTANDVPSGTLLINNVVAQTTTTDPNLLNNTDTVTTTVEQSFGPTADLALDKHSPATDVVAGTRITYTLTVTNAGPATATNVRLLELIPAGTTVLALTAHNPASAGEFCSLGGTCDLGAILPGATALITVVLQVDADFAGTTLINRASVAADQPDPNPANNLAETSTPVRRETDLSITKVDLPDPIIVGETLLYQIVITNSGPSAAHNVVISDTLDPNTYFSGADPSCTHNGSAPGGVVTCVLNTLPTDTTTSILLQVRVDPSLITNTVLLNQVTVTSSTPDTNPANNGASQSTQAYLGALIPVDLAIAKTATPTTVTAGEVVTYTLVITNYGAGTANNIHVVDALPLGAVTLLAVTSSQGLCNAGIVCDLGNLVLDQTATITLVVRVHADQTTDLLNLARVSASNPDTDASNNQATATVAVTTAADLSIIKTATPVTATAGGGLSYQILVRNAGPSDAQNVVVNDLLPSELTGVSFGASQGSCSAGSCTLGVIPAGGQATISVAGTVAANASAPFTNTANVVSTTLDPNANNNQSSVTVAVRGSADLMLDLTSTPTVNGGETAVVTVTLFNQGPSYAVGTVVTVTLPASVTFANATLPTGWTAVDNGNGTVTLTANVPITPSVAIALPLSVNIDPNLEPGTSLQFSATVTAMTYDPNPFNNSDNADSTINARADLVIDKRGPATLTAGKLVTYTIVVTNQGPSTAQTVDIKDQLPTGLSLVRVTVQRNGSGPALCAGLVCQPGDMSRGEIVTVTVVAQAAANLAQGSVITNTAAVFSSSHDPDQSTNVDGQVATVTTLAGLTISKQATPNPAVPGAALMYQIAVFNAGPSDAQQVVVNDTLPIGFQTTSISSDLGLCNTLPCTLGTVPAGTRILINIQGQVASSVTTPLVNHATVTSTTPLTATNDTSTTITTNVSPRADLHLDIHSTPTANAGETAVVTVTLRNEGPSNAAGTRVTVTLPVGTNFVSANLPIGWTAVDQGNGTVVITAGTPFTPGLAINLPLTVALAATLEPGSSLQFNATVTATTPDPDLTDNTGNSDTSVIGKADLVLNKTGPTLVTAGAQVTYTIVVSNQGPSTARFVDVKDTLPEGINLVRASIRRTGPGAATCGGTVCQAGNMPVGELITITVVGNVAADVAAGTVLTNTATAFANTPDPNPNNHVDTWQSRVQTLANLRIRKRDLSDPVTPGQILIYSIDVINSGPSYARDVIVTDRLPAGVTYTGSTGNCVQSPIGTLRCTVAGAPLVGVAPGTTASFLIAVTVDATVVSGLYLNNTATLASSTPLTDSILADSEETLVQQFLGPPADLVLEKQAYSAAVMANGLVTYTLTITNYGPATATDVKVLDALPTGLTLVRTVASQGLCESGITCFLGTLIYTGVPSTVRVTVVARAATAIRQGTTLTNTALVQGSQPDPIQANNLDAVGVIVETAADLTIKKTGAPNPAVAGEQLLYTIVVTNTGPADAVAVVVTDGLPVGFTQVNLSPSQGVCVATGVCQLGNLPVHGKVTISVLGMVAPNITGVITNTVTVSSTTDDPNLNNNRAISVIPVYGRADLAVDVTATPTVLSGETGVVTVTVYNHGPSNALGTVITVTIPPETTYDSANLPPGWTAIDQGNGIVVIQASVPLIPGVPIDLPLLVKVAPGLELGTSYQVSAIVAAATPDDNPFDNKDNADTSVVGKADVQVTKVASADPVEAGATLIYTITVENHGPSFAQDVDIKEFLPVSVTLQDLSTSQGACISNICQLGRIGISETVMITVVTVVDPDLPPGTPLVNKAIAFTDSRDPDPANNTDEVTVLVGPVADLRLVKLINKTVVKPGSQMIYTLVITNFGPSIAPAVVVTDTLPNGMLYLQNEPLCRENTPRVVVCRLGDMVPNQTAQINLITLIETAVMSGAAKNTAQIRGGDMFDPDPGNNLADVTVEVVNLPTASEIVRFLPISGVRSITLEWTTILEIDLLGFHLLRSTIDNTGQAVRITSEMIESQGTRGGSYSFVDPDVVAGVHYAYWLQEIAADGTVYLNGPIYVVFGAIDKSSVIFLPVVEKN